MKLLHKETVIYLFFVANLYGILIKQVKELENIIPFVTIRRNLTAFVLWELLDNIRK